ncbi:LacI family transcriptional regulator [Oceanispirochaeta crateris]|uniref:LacI family transcriptional regulator n=1 Tax=Oceanispirochaeta crateris TaxID=2518645 RepID=A0A5C1QGR1_9SPIO|nr:LacI family DNA-binding transcriptional regulator [Oceanispirochaeta crateris]QEN06647.1 LacI family transcriptional regulator [Oceanispirochaeta crateris]
MNKRATIYDVAEDAEVSITTVSRYLNNPESVKKETGLRISSSMEKLDYIRQGNAGSNASRSFRRVGVLTPFFPAPSFVERLRGMIPYFKEKNFEVIIYTIESPEQLAEYLSSVPFTRRLDGLILMSIHLTPAQNRLLQASDLHVVMIESDDENYSRILADDQRGGQMAAELFIKKNYLPCAFMGDENQSITYSCHPSELRLKGYMETLQDEGVTLPDSLIMESNTTVEDSHRVFRKFLDEGNRVRAIFAMCDLQAIGIMKAAREMNIRIPEDLAVLGFDDIESADWMGLSSISQHLGDSGRISAKLLLELITGNSNAIQKVNLQVELIERGTT